MAHELTTTNGKVEMAFYGQVPWHGLGQELKPGASIEEWKAAAGMEWSIEEGEVFMQHGEELIAVPGRVGLYRGDTHAPLSIVSDRYHPVQPGEVLEFFRDFVELGGVHLSTAGTLFGGKRMWALAKLENSFEITKGDRVDTYLLLSTSCDGSLPTTARPTTVRVVCNNTLSLATTRPRGQSNQLKDMIIKVSHRTRFSAIDVQKQLADIGILSDEFERVARQLIHTKITLPEAKDFVESLLLDTKTIFSKEPRETRQFKNVIDIFSREASRKSKKAAPEGSAWSLVNAVTEYIDHHTVTTTPSHRLDSAWFGRGAIVKREAFDRAYLLAT